MPAKELSPMEKVKLAKSAAEQQKIYASATEKTANAEERLARAIEKKEKAAKQGLSKQGMDEYIKSVIEATEEVENLKKEQEAVGKGTATLGSQWSRNFGKAIYDSTKTADKGFAKTTKKAKALWEEVIDAALEYKKAGKTAQAEVLLDMGQAEVQLNKLSGDKSKINKEQLDQLRNLVKTEEQILSLNAADRDVARETNEILKQKLGLLDKAVALQKDMDKYSESVTGWFKEANKVLDKMKTPAGAFMIILTAVASLLKKGFESVRNINSALGVGVGDAAKMTKNLAFGAPAAYAAGLGKNLEDAATASANVSGNLDLMKNTALAISDAAIALQTGMSAENVAELAEGLSITTKLSRETASEMLGSVANFAKMNKVAPKKVLEDMANSAETLAKYSDGTAEGMARAAVHAAKLGLNLSKVGSLADNLLDLESSIAAEFEAQVLTGKDLNLDRARQLALNNDLEGVMNEIVNQVGSEAEFQKMNAIERESLAKAVGLSTEDLAAVMSKGAGAELGGNFEDKSLKSQSDLIAQGAVMEGKADTLINLSVAILAAIVGGQMLKGLKNLFKKGNIFKHLSGKGGAIKNVLSRANPLNWGAKRGVTGAVKGSSKGWIGKTATKAKGWIGAGPKAGTAGRVASGASKLGTAGKLLKGGAIGLAGEVGGMIGNYGEKHFREKGMENAARASDIGGKAARGAGYGAAVGSIIPGFGTAAGALIGGGIGAGIGVWQNYSKEIKGFFSSAGEDAKKYAGLAKDKALEMGTALKKGTQAMRDMGEAASTKVKAGLDKAKTALSSFAKAGGVKGWFGRMAQGAKDLLVGSKEKGGPITKTGSYLVGEAGPELVNLSAGSSVVPNKYMGGMEDGQFGKVDTESIVAAINSLKADLNAIKANTGTTSEGVNRIQIGAAA